MPMSTHIVIIAALFLAIPISIKYLLAFETRNLVESLKAQEKEVKFLSAQFQALEQERQVLRKAVNQIESQCRRARTRRSLVEEALGRMRHLGT